MSENECPNPETLISTFPPIKRSSYGGGLLSLWQMTIGSVEFRRLTLDSHKPCFSLGSTNKKAL